MTKPFSPRELVARVKALLRRVQRAPEPERRLIELDGLAVDPTKREIRVRGDAVHLTPIEFDLLYALASRPGVVHSRERLLSEVWGYRDGLGARTVDSHVRSLRRKLGAGLIRTVHGVGYAFREDVS
jgi:DNA-binding response OmpR family regulator